MLVRVLTVLSSFAVCCVVLAQQPEVATIPPNLIPVIRDDLDGGDLNACLEQQQKTFEQMLDTRWIKLNPSGDAALVIRGFGPCLGGANNGPFLIYSRFGYGRLGDAWRKVFED